MDIRTLLTPCHHVPKALCMIIEFDSYLKNDDFRTFADFIRTSVQKNPLGFSWMINLECAQTVFAREYNLAPGRSTTSVFSLFINDALSFGGYGNTFYLQAVCNTVAGWAGESKGFSNEDVYYIHETLQYLHRNKMKESVDTGKIFTGRIDVVSRIYHFCHPSLWAVYNPDIVSILDIFADDFRNADPAATDRLGDKIQFPLPGALEGSDRAPVKVVQLSLLVRCIADNFVEHGVVCGSNRDWWPDHKWGPPQVAMALSWLGMTRRTREEISLEDERSMPMKPRLTNME